MKTIKGTCVFPGIVLADVVFLKPTTAAAMPSFEGTEIEIQKLQKSQNLSRAQIEKIKTWTEKKLGAHEAEIFEAHLMMVDDPEYWEQVFDEVKTRKTPASLALQIVTQGFADILSKSNSEYLRERVADLKDVSQRLIKNLNPSDLDLASDKDAIIIADDLTPSDLINYVSMVPLKGVALVKGGFTSHTAILLKSMGIPSVFGLSETPMEKSHVVSVLDSEKGELILDPDSNTKYEIQKKIASREKNQQQLEIWKTKKTQLLDGSTVSMVANVANQKAVEQAVENGTEGVGLYRTEFFFMDRSAAPSEDEQFETYKKALQTLNGKPLVIRTLDIGGDKEISYLKLPKEENPFLGVRGLRLCLQHPEIFLPQLKALVRASEFGPLHVMFPMVTDPSELEQVFKLIPKSSKIKWGMMLEIPANLFMIPEFSKHVEFFSVGSNDLTQYLTACDRMNSSLQKLSDPYSPGVLRALKYLGDQVKRSHRELSICGEIASDPLLVPFLIGIGAQKLSQNSLLIPQSRYLASKLTRSSCEDLVNRVVALSSRDDVLGALQSFKSDLSL